VPATVLSQCAYQVDPSFRWATNDARISIFSWSRDVFLLKHATFFQPLVDLPDDCIGDVLEYLMSTLTRTETVHITLHWPSPEAHSWIRAVVAAAVKVRNMCVLAHVTYADSRLKLQTLQFFSLSIHSSYCALRKGWGPLLKSAI